MNNKITITNELFRFKLILIALIVFVLTWAAFYPLDEGISVSGQVIITSNKKVIQHKTGGLIKDIHVYEGQFVKKGDLLLRLNSTEIETTLSSLKLQESYLSKDVQAKKELMLEGFYPRLTYEDLFKQLQDIRNKLLATEEDLNRQSIRAPVDGQIIGFKKQTIGLLIQPGEAIAEIVPANEDLVIEVRIPVNLIDRVTVDDLVDVRFSGFEDVPLLVVEGKLLHIAKDTLTQESQTVAQNPAFYMGRVILTKDGIEKLGHRSITPGMFAETLIKTGKRTLLSYLVKPISRRVATSVAE